MKSIIITTILLIQFIAYSKADEIRINQVGYYPKANKWAIVVNTTASHFKVLDVETKKIVYKGKLSSIEICGDSGDTIRKADFSSLSKPGKYVVQVGNCTSYPFKISNDALRQISVALLKSFYFQRCSYELKEPFAGKWKRPAGHPDTACVYHGSSGKTGKLSSPGGWYDAGDYGKYVVNAGISVAEMLESLELFPTNYPDGSLNIPESGNGKNDLLDEIKFELDWLKTMQDVDGGVFFKITTKEFGGMIMPEADTAQRYVIGKSTTSTLDFAAMMAIASRSYQNFNAEYASDCRLRAERAWKWAIQHPSAFFINPPDIHTGTYADSHVDDEFIFAAAELYIATNDNEYKNFLLKRPEQLLYNHAPDWPHMQETGVLSLAVMSNNFPPDIKNKIQQSVIKHADTTRMQVNNSPYRIPKIEYHWGSNGRMANEGLCLVYAFKLTGDTSYIITANEIADYLLGKNATGFSFITGFGSKQPMYIHHRPSIADRIIQPIPGFVVGGPNNDKQDIRAGVVYTSTWPAKAYLDSEKSFASNEVCINWNAPAVALFAAIDNILGSKYLADWAQYYVLPK